MSKQTDDELYIDIVQRVSQQSKAVRLKVGALLVNDGVMVIGYNGTPKGWDNCCEDKVVSDFNGDMELKTKPEVIHAEMNVFKKVANNPNVIKGGTLYVTHSPCTECAKLFLSMGLKRVVYLNKYRSDAGLELLRRDKIEVEYRTKKDDNGVKITDFDKLLSSLPTEEVSIGDDLVVDPPKIELDNLNSLIERLPIESHVPLGEGVVGFSAAEERLAVLPEEEVPSIISALSFASNEEVPLTDAPLAGMSDTDRRLMEMLLKESQGSA